MGRGRAPQRPGVSFAWHARTGRTHASCKPSVPRIKPTTRTSTRPGRRLRRARRLAHAAARPCLCVFPAHAAPQQRSLQTGVLYEGVKPGAVNSRPYACAVPKGRAWGVRAESEPLSSTNAIVQQASSSVSSFHSSHKHFNSLSSPAPRADHSPGFPCQPDEGLRRDCARC